jgi:phosphonate transport system substrate-binding protein
MRNVYAFIARYVGEQLGWPTELSVGDCYADIAKADVAFLCSLPYVEMTRQPKPPVEPLAAPVLAGERYGGRAVYFSDIVVRRDSPFGSFADLRGRSWAYNEPHSHSGYGITRQRLIELCETRSYFGKVVETGWHEQSIRMVCAGEVDASAIDSHVLAVACRDDPELANRLRIIDSFGPSPIQPVVAARHLPDSLKSDLGAVLLSMVNDTEAQKVLAHSFIDCFVPADDSDYDAIRGMLMTAEAAGFMTIL